MYTLPVPVALLAIVVFAAALLQTLSGFGFSLIVMPLITLVMGLRTAAPLVALAGLTLYTINVIRYRRSINFDEVLRLGAAAALGVPVGVWALTSVSESIIKPALGLILIAYALYSLLAPKVAQLQAKGWVYVAGFAAGCLGGAYNTPGPPVVVYGSLRHWPKDEFRAAVQSLFFLTASLTVASHFFARRLTGSILTFYAAAVPAMLLGLFVGARIDRRVDKDRFRAIVTVMILLLGLSLIFSA